MIATDSPWNILLGGGLVLLGGLGVKWMEIRAHNRERREDREDEGRARRRADLRDLQDVIEGMYRVLGASLDPVPTSEPVQAAILAASLRARSVAAKIGDEALAAAVSAYSSGCIDLALNNPSDGLVETIGASGADINRRISELYGLTER